MIWILLQLESPWQRNDAILFFIYICVSLYQEVFFLRNLLSEYVPSVIVSIMAKFEEEDMGVYGIAVLSFFSSGISVILILMCGITVSSSPVVCGFSRPSG